MNRVVKVIAAGLVLAGFNVCLFAKPASYQFSGFGGGLPSSAMELTADEGTDLDSINTDLEEAKSEKEPWSPTKKALVITASVVGGVLVIGGIALGIYFLQQETSKCCEGLTQSCTDSCSQSISDSISQSCSSKSILAAPGELLAVPIYIP